MSSARRPSPVSSSHSPPPPLNSTSPSSSSTTTTTTTASHHSPPMSDEDDAGLPPTSTNTNPTTPPSPSPSSSPPPPPSSSTDVFPLPPPPLPSSTTKTTSFPIREDCWSEDATHTLIEAWGSHYLDLNRGNLRQKHWQEVADAVNTDHAHTKKLHRTDIQCKNRIDTLKKKYKLEKAKVLQSNGRVVSTWPFFASLDPLIGDSFIKANAPASGTPPVTRKNSLAAKNTSSPSPAAASAPATMTVRKEFPVLPPLPSAVPVGPRSKRPAPAPAMGEEAVFRRNFSAMAAAAAAAAEDNEDEEESDTSSAAAVGLRSGGMKRKKRRRAAGKVAAEGYRKLAEAIGGFAEIYERVEEAKQRQMVELEKQRMQFAKDLEIQRMKLFMESQVQLEKLKRSKRNSQSGDGYL